MSLLDGIPYATVFAGTAPRLSGDAILRDVRANFCNLDDGRGDGDKSIIYTSVTATVYVRQRDRFDDWLRLQQGNGSTHIGLNVPDGDPSYGGVWSQPDLWSDLDTYMDVLETLLSTASASGNGYVPMIFLDDGSANPLPRIQQRWPRMVEKLRTRGLIRNVIGILAFEPEAWSALEISEGLKLLHSLAPEMKIGYHGWPRRLVGSSNPVQPDDPWQGGEAIFYTEHGGEFIDIAFYQTEHGHGDGSIYDWTCPVSSSDCWLDRFNDYVLRIGGGYHGWRKLPLVLFETVTYEYIRYQATSQDARDVATRGKSVADHPYAEDGDYTGGPVAISYGNGMPWWAA